MDEPDESTRSEKLFQAQKMTHEKTDYRNAPGCKKLGIKNARPYTDAKNSEFIVIGEDANGFKVCLNRDEALETIYLPTPEEIEKRKQECKFLFPHSQRVREKGDEQEAMTIPFIVQPETSRPRLRSRGEY